MSALNELAVETIAYLDAKQATQHKRDEYRRVRDHYIAANGAGRDWKELVCDPSFQMFTNKAYREWRNARSQQYNAERRMMTRYRKTKMREVA